METTTKRRRDKSEAGTCAQRIVLLKLLTGTKHRAVSLRQQGYLLIADVVYVSFSFAFSFSLRHYLASEVLFSVACICFEITTFASHQCDVEKTVTATSMKLLGNGASMCYDQVAASYNQERGEVCRDCPHLSEDKLGLILAPHLLGS